jgi:hypothetical protein
MQERVLEFRRRVLPPNHPDIGEGRVGSGIACGLWIAMVCVLFSVFDVQARR